MCAYDPVVAAEAAETFAGNADVGFAESPMAALDGADALLIVTEWKEFRSPDFDAIRESLKHPVIIDGRNMYDPAMVRVVRPRVSGHWAPLSRHRRKAWNAA